MVVAIINYNCVCSGWLADLMQWMDGCVSPFPLFNVWHFVVPSTHHKNVASCIIRNFPQIPSIHVHRHPSSPPAIDWVVLHVFSALLHPPLSAAHFGTHTPQLINQSSIIIILRSQSVVWVEVCVHGGARRGTGSQGGIILGTEQVHLLDGLLKLVADRCILVA